MFFQGLIKPLAEIFFKMFANVKALKSPANIPLISVAIFAGTE